MNSGSIIPGLPAVQPGQLMQALAKDASDPALASCFAALLGASQKTPKWPSAEAGDPPSQEQMDLAIELLAAQMQTPVNISVEIECGERFDAADTSGGQTGELAINQAFAGETEQPAGFEAAQKQFDQPNKMQIDTVLFAQDTQPVQSTPPRMPAADDAQKLEAAIQTGLKNGDADKSQGAVPGLAQLTDPGRAEMTRVQGKGLDKIMTRSEDLPDKSQADFQMMLDRQITPAQQPAVPLAQGVATKSNPVLDAEPISGEQLVGQVVEQAEFDLTAERQSIRIRLKPDHFGELEIQVSRSGGQLEASILTDKEQTREMLSAHLGQLQTALETRGIKVDTLQIRSDESAAADFQSSFDDKSGQQPDRDLPELDDIREAARPISSETDPGTGLPVTGRINTVV